MKITIKNIDVKMAGFKVFIGVPAGSQFDGVSNEDKALWLEYGKMEGGNLAPARPFMLRTLQALKKENLPINGDEIGRLGVEKMQNIMDTDSFAPLKPTTIYARRRRGNSSTQPTVDTGNLRDSIAYEVVK